MTRGLLVFLILLVGCASGRALPEREPSSTEAGAGIAPELFRLHSGRKILLPFRSDNYDYLFLQGTADLTALNQILLTEDLTAIPGRDGQGIVGIFISKYNSTSIGPYQEILVAISAQPRSLKDSGGGLVVGTMPLPSDAAAPAMPYYVWQAAVDSPVALDMGREVWGYPMSLGAIELITQAADWTFRYSGVKPKGLVFEGKCGNCGAVPKPKFASQFTLISGYGVRRTLARSESFGPTVVRPYDGSVDAFNLKAGTPLAGLLKKVGFRPIGWVIGESVAGENGL